MRPRFLLAALALTCAGCLAGRGAKGGFELELAAELDERLGGVAVGDLDVRFPGDEIAVVGARGGAWLVRYDAELEDFVVEEIARMQGEKIQCAAGDFDTEHPGDELVMVGVATGGEDDGGRGQVVYAARSTEGWNTRVLFEEDSLLHAVCVGDIDPQRPGNEVLVAGASGDVYVLGVRAGSATARTRVARLSTFVKGAAAGRGGAVLSSTDGSVRRVRFEGGSWRSDELARFDGAQSRIAVGPLSEGHPILVGGDAGVLRLLRPGTVAGARSTVVAHTTPARLRGALFADLDPARDGFEMATADDAGELSVVLPVVRGARAVPVAQDGAMLHAVAAGVLPRFGPSLAACGDSGRVLVVHRGD